MSRKQIGLILSFGSLVLAGQPAQRNWQEGALHSVELVRGTAWRLAEVDLVIEAEAVTYKMQLKHIGRKADLIPFVGIVTVAERQKKTHLDVKAGTIVKFSVAAQRGWIIDNDGIEQELIVRSATSKTN